VAPLLFAVTGTVALSVAQRAHCVQRGWTGSDQFWHACFSDLPSLYQLGGLDAGLGSFLSGSGARTDHPVLTGAVMAAVGGLVPHGSFLDQTRWYFALWAALAAVLAVATVWFTAASRPRHVADAAQVALSPVLLMTAMVSSDLFGVALASAGIWAWSRRRPVLAGVLLGLAVTARTYPLLILLALVLLAVRTGRFEGVRRVVVAAAATVGLIVLPVLLTNPEAVMRPYEAWWDSLAGLGSPWMIPQLLGGLLPAGAVTLLAVAGLVIAVVAGALFALSTWRRPTLAEVSFVLVAVALVTGKSFPVQASLWLVPLVALCGVRWRDHLVWAGAEALHFVAVWLYVGGLSRPDRGMPPQWYAVFLTVRLLAVLYLVYRVWRTASLRPEAPDLLVVPSTSYPAGADEGVDEGLRRSSGIQGRQGWGLGGLEPDPDSDAVVDELAGEFTDAPDQLVVRIG
jgi:uncharacterized membrane protein